jgi:hypothetical protein
MSPYSTPYPKQPLAAMSGFLSVSAPIFVVKSTSVLPHESGGVEHRPADARADVVKAAGGFHRDDAGVAAAEAASHHALDRHLAGAAAGRQARYRGQHRLGAARLDQHARVG